MTAWQNIVFYSHKGHCRHWSTSWWLRDILCSWTRNYIWLAIICSDSHSPTSSRTWKVRVHADQTLNYQHSWVVLYLHSSLHHRLRAEISEVLGNKTYYVGKKNWRNYSILSRFVLQTYTMSQLWLCTNKHLHTLICRYCKESTSILAVTR